MATKKKEIENKAEVKEETKKKNKSLSEIKKELKKNAKDIDVEIMNISNGGVIYQKGNVYIDLDSIEGTSIVSLDDLLTLKGKEILDKLFISIIDTYSDYELKDIIEMLGLTKSYKYCEMTIEGLDKFIEETDSEEFKKIINSADSKFVSRIIERSVFLAKNKGFDSNYKRSILEEKTDNRFLFNVI